MTSTLLTNIGELTTNDPEADDLLGLVEDAALVVDGSTVAWVGRAADAPPADEALDLGGRAVLPGFVDSHSHLVFAGDRAAEFAARMAGESYAAGGIRTTVAATGPPPTSSSPATWPASWRRCAARAPPPSRSRAATG